MRACEGSIGAGLKQVRTLCAWWQISASLTSSQSASFVDFATATKSLHTAQVPFVTPRIACNSKPTYVDARAASRLIGGYEYRWSSLKFLFLFLLFISFSFKEKKLPSSRSIISRDASRVPPVLRRLASNSADRRINIHVGTWTIFYGDSLYSR